MIWKKYDLLAFSLLFLKHFAVTETWIWVHSQSKLYETKRSILASHFLFFSAKCIPFEYFSRFCLFCCLAMQSNSSSLSFLPWFSDLRDKNDDDWGSLCVSLVKKIEELLEGNPCLSFPSFSSCCSIITLSVIFGRNIRELLVIVTFLFSSRHHSQQNSRFWRKRVYVMKKGEKVSKGFKRKALEERLQGRIFKMSKE